MSVRPNIDKRAEPDLKIGWVVAPVISVVPLVLTFSYLDLQKYPPYSARWNLACGGIILVCLWMISAVFTVRLRLFGNLLQIRKYPYSRWRHGHLQKGGQWSYDADRYRLTVPFEDGTVWSKVFWLRKHELESFAEAMTRQGLARRDVPKRTKKVRTKKEKPPWIW
jgi:hypothetical protein